MYFFIWGVTLMLVCLVMMLFVMTSYKKLSDSETFSTYECGFSPYSSTRLYFSFRFFLIAILFLIFDVEIVLMLPLPYVMLNLKILSTSYVFFLILLLGLLYEYYYGALNWLNFISKA